MKTNQPLFSVLIANYNNGKYLLEAIESVRRQTYANWEIVLVDDSSTDNSNDVYTELEKDERISIYRNEKNMGCGYTKRRCAELAKGEICGFLDPDDALIENALELEAKIHVERPEVSIVYSKPLYCDSDFNVIEYGRLPKLLPGETYLDHRKHGPMNFASYKNALYSKTSGLNPSLKAGVDQDLYFRMEEVGEIAILDQFTYKYVVCGHAEALSTSPKNKVAMWYWNLCARRDAFLRRGKPYDVLIGDFKEYLDEYARVCIENESQDIIKQIVDEEVKKTLFIQESRIRNTKAYRLGNALLKPFKWFSRNKNL